MASQSDPVLLKYKEAIEDFFYQTAPTNLYIDSEKVGYQFESDRHQKLQNTGAWNSNMMRLVSVSPSTLYDGLLDTLWKNDTLGLGLTEQLYTARGF